jgi:molybdopterin-guanine dinucleotide biosynthesis protein MobB
MINNKNEENDAMMRLPKPLLGFSAFPGTGKTDLILQLLSVFKSQGLHVAVIKQTQDDIDADQSQEDSLEFSKAGAEHVLMVADNALAMTEIGQQSVPELGNLLEWPDMENIDLILIEGFRHLPFARIELHRSSLGNKLLFPEDNSIIAVASDEYLETGGLPLLNIELPKEVAGYISRWLRFHPHTVQLLMANADN